MSVRGRPANLRPLTPPNPTLSTRPVPRTRNYMPRSFGPGAAKSSFEADEILGTDPTWGFYAFVTDYSPDTLEKIPQAMENLIELTRRNIRSQSTSAYTEEAYRRFKLDIMGDEEALSGASDDRIRAEFRAPLRTLQQLGEDDFIHASACNYVCLVLDKPAIFMLADLSFPESERDDWPRFREKTIKVVDAWWKRPAANVSVSSYRGVGYCPINSLARFYMLVSTDANSGAMQDLCLFGVVLELIPPHFTLNK